MLQEGQSPQPENLNLGPHVKIEIQTALHPIFDSDYDKFRDAYLSGRWNDVHPWDPELAQRIKGKTQAVACDGGNPLFDSAADLYTRLPAEPLNFTSVSPLTVILGDPGVSLERSIQPVSADFNHAGLTPEQLQQVLKSFRATNLDVLNSNLTEIGVNMGSPLIVAIATYAALFRKEKLTKSNNGKKITRGQFLSLVRTASELFFLSQVAKLIFFSSASMFPSNEFSDFSLKTAAKIPSIPVDRANDTNFRTALLWVKMEELAKLLGFTRGEIILGANHGYYSKTLETSPQERDRIILEATAEKITEVEQALKDEPPEIRYLGVNYLIQLIASYRGALVNDPRSLGITEYPYKNPHQLVERCVSMGKIGTSRNVLNILRPLIRSFETLHT